MPIQALLGHYLDTLNLQGREAAREFLAQHKGNRELHQLAKRAREVQSLFADGLLKPACA